MKKNNTLNFYKSSILVAAFAMGFGFTSCDDDDDLVFSGKPIANAEMRAFLEGKGYQFNDAGNLLMDAKVAATDTLDLTGSKLTDLSDLVLFPNLKYVDLSDNGYGPVYDFANLPQNIQGVDLTGNEIYDFEGLVEASMTEKDGFQVNILRNFSSLQLPASAKFNVEDLMPFYEKNKADGKKVNMTMEDKSGAMKEYNTLREIPDAALLTYLKTAVGESIFEGNMLNIAKPIDDAHAGGMIGFDAWEPFHAELTSFEGLEYFINNPYYKTFGISVEGKEGFSVEYLMPGANLKCLGLVSVDTKKGVNLSKATGLGLLQLKGNPSLKSVDLSNTQVCNASVEDFEFFKRSFLNLTNCVNLEEIILPKAEGDKAIASNFEIINAPKLKSLDISNLVGFNTIALLNLGSCTITYPTELKYSVDANHKKLNPISAEEQISLALSEDVFAMQATKNFTTKYNTQLMDVWYNYMDFENVTMWQ